MNRESAPGVTFTPSQTVKSSYLAHPFLGILVGAFIFVIGLTMDPSLSVILHFQEIDGQIEGGYAYAALILVVIGLCILFASATSLLTKETDPVNDEIPSAFAKLRKVLSKRPYPRLLMLSATVYSIFYALASGIIVYNPRVTFSIVYHTSIPSSSVAVCCAPLGQTPVAVVYLTEHLGLLLVPANLFLLFSLSWLVGLNVALGTFVFSLQNSKRDIGWIGGIGAAVGLFTSCPTCAGVAILSILGGSSVLSVSFFLGPLQDLLLALSVPALLASPALLMRSLQRMESQACRAFRGDERLGNASNLESP